MFVVLLGRRSLGVYPSFDINRIEWGISKLIKHIEHDRLRQGV
ncbi:hypothetical protein VCSRO86_2346 [Vibrio cholerae]|nr:hypothetical protein VCSRO86_2346 [Vibrio cholerae]